MSTQPILPGLEKGSTNEELTNMALISSLFMPKGGKSLGGLRILLMIFLSYITTPLEMFLRVEHGERTLSLLRVVNSLVALQILGIASFGMSAVAQQIVRSSVYAGMIDVESSGIAVNSVFQTAFLVASAYHLWRISYRRRKGILWHSMSVGISVLEVTGILDFMNYLIGRINLFGRWKIPYRISRWTIYLYIEPILGILAAQVIQRFDAPTAGWLVLASAALFVRNQMHYAQERHSVLDYWDSLLDSEYLRAAADQRPPQETAGVTVIPGFAEALAHAESSTSQAASARRFPQNSTSRQHDATGVNYAKQTLICGCARYRVQ